MWTDSKVIWLVFLAWLVAEIALEIYFRNHPR